MTITFPGAVYELRQNQALDDMVANIVLNKNGSIDYEYGIDRFRVFVVVWPGQSQIKESVQ